MIFTTMREREREGEEDFYTYKYTTSGNDIVINITMKGK